jgi:predicted nucleic acid-binding protein
MTGEVLLDSAVVLYALGGASPRREACQDVLRQVADGYLEAYASTEMIQEVLHHRLRVTGDRARAAAQARDVMQLVTLVPFDRPVLVAAIDLAETSSVRGRDAVHAATALTRGIERLVSTDQAFEAVPGLEWVRPEDLVATQEATE